MFSCLNLAPLLIFCHLRARWLGESTGAQVQIATVPLWSEVAICIKRLSLTKEIPIDYVYEDKKDATLLSYEFFLDWLGPVIGAPQSAAYVGNVSEPFDCR